MLSIKVHGKTVRVPDFYKSEFPELYRVEVQKQLNQSHMSQVRLQESDQVNYINRNRGVKEMHNDMDRLRLDDTPDEEHSTDDNNEKRDKKKGKEPIRKQ